MKSGKTIVLLTPGFAKDETDTSCIPLLQAFVNELKLQCADWKIYIIAFQYPEVERKYSWNGIPVFSAGGNDSKWKRLSVWRKSWKQLKQIHKLEKIDLLHSFWLSETTLIAQLFANRFSIPHAATAFGQDVKSSNRYLSFLNFNKIKTVVISEWQQKFLFPKKIITRCIPFGINPNSFSQHEQERTIDIFGAGSLSELKNYELFVSVIAEIKKTLPQIRAVLAGDGPERNHLEELKKKFQLENNLHFSGHMNREHVLSRMQQSKIFLHTSTFEGEGFVLLEALASGCRVVSSNVGIAAQIEKIAVCVSKDEMVKEILRMLNGQFIPERVYPFTIQQTVAQYLHLYN
jgi:1,2-diacylglycerol 3-alpha-glucosyltransferase